VGLAENDHVIEKLSTNRSHKTFRGPILPGTLECRSLGMDSESRDRAGDLGREDRVVVEDEIAMRRVIGKGLSQLVDHPPSRGMAGDIEVEDTPSPVVEYEPDVEQREAHRRDDEEVHSRDHVPVIPQECHPPLMRVRARVDSRQVPRNGRQSEVDPQLR
jgi:hypothetical protein